MVYGFKNYCLLGFIGLGIILGCVYLGKKMVGYLGNVWVIIRKLKIVRIDVEWNLLLIKGSIFGKLGILISIVLVNIVG